jgi:transcription elongation factor Elf1
MADNPRFTWERAPFDFCPMCGTDKSYGVLSAGGKTLTRRCTACGFSEGTSLPAVDKKVIYLDQFAFSELFKLRSGKRREDKHTDFWRAADDLINRVALLQQAIFPPSDVHHSETLVSPWPQELRDAYEALAGDVRLEDTRHIELSQIAALARGFIAGEQPELDLTVDNAVRGRRNAWLSDIRISVQTDYSQFADDTRKNVEETAQQVVDLMEGWRKRGLGFDEVLEIELGSYHQSRLEALQAFAERYERAIASDDFMAELNVGMSSIVREMSVLRDVFSRAGVAQDELDPTITRFWKWPGNQEQPFGRILAYLFAALAGQVKAGRTKPATRGFMNDVKAISAYAPYLDAMFVDKECATLLTEGRPRDELVYRARIFSLNTQSEFIDYLTAIEANASDEVRHFAKIVYGI